MTKASPIVDNIRGAEGPGLGAPAEKVIIIGAGVAGLSCGCYLQMSGVPTEILEAGELPGGLCTAWHRGPYVFDGCLRWLIGAQQPSAFHQIWSELGAISGRRVFIPEEILRIEGLRGHDITIPTDLAKLGAVLKGIAPEDGPMIDRLLADARKCADLEPPLHSPVELLKPIDRMKLGMRYVRYLPSVMRYKNARISDYLARFKSPALREALRIIVGHDEMSALVLMMLFAFRSRNNTGFVAGGSWDFGMAIAERYKKLGGVLTLNAPVETIEVENNSAAGVRCEGGRRLGATAVVSCADGYTTIFKMLGGQYTSRRLRQLYERQQPFPPILQISLGVKKTFDGTPATVNLPLAAPLAVDDQTRHTRMEVETFGVESGLCPEGCTEMTVRLQTRHDYWADLKRGDPPKYREEKRRLGREITAALERRFPGVEANVEQTDVATPATFVRYTGNWRGSYQGWLPTPGILGRPIPTTLPGLKNFHMAGHWVVAGGGLPAAALAGRYAAQMICAGKSKVFATSRP